MQKIVFADTIKKIGRNVLRIPDVIIDDPIFRLHYKATGLALLLFGVLVSGYQLFGNPIMCIQKDDVPSKLLNTYCWIEGTFSLPKAFTKKIGSEVVYPGVEQYEDGDEVIEHAYYQWVCFFMLLQAVLFRVPYSIWKMLEGGRLKILIEELKKPLVKKSDKEKHYKNLACYFRARRYEHYKYALKFLFCEFLNFINVVGQIYFINRFLGYQFTKYGSDVLTYANEEQENRFDPMIRVFPRISKCTFRRYGPSGDVQKHDALCLLPLNILNEKLFLIIWFWYVILAVLGGATLIYRLIILSSSRMRFTLLNVVSSLTPKEDLTDLIPRLTYGDWFVLYMLADNIENMHFRDFVSELKKDGKCFQYQDIPPGSLTSKDDKEKEKKLSEGKPTHAEIEV